jgi:hypothetical protein
VVPRVGIAKPAGRREVRRVEQDGIEPAEPVGEVGADHLQRKALPPRRRPEGDQRERVEVGRHDPVGMARGAAGDQPVPASDLEDAPAGALGERHQELGVLAYGVHPLVVALRSRHDR